MIIKITSIWTVGTFLIIFTITSEALKIRTRHFITGDKARQHPVRNNHYIWPNEEKFIKILGNFFNHTTQYSTSAKNLDQPHKDAVIYTTEEIMKEQTNIEMNIERSIASSVLIHRDRSLLKTLGHVNHDTNASERLEFKKNNHQPLYIQNELNSKSQKLIHFRMLTELLKKSPHAHIPDTYATFHQRDHQGKDIDSDTSATKLALAVMNENTNIGKKPKTLNKYNVRIGIKFYVNDENCKNSSVQDKNRNKDNSQCTNYIIIPEMNQNENLKRVINNSMFKLMPIEATNFIDHKISEKQNLFGEEPHKLFPDNLDPLFLERIQNITLNPHAQVEDSTFPISGLYWTSHKVTSKGDNQNNLALYEYPSIYLQPPLYSSSSRGQISSLKTDTYNLPEAYYSSAQDDINNEDYNKVPILSMHNLTGIQNQKYITTGVSQHGNIKFPSFNSQFRDTRPNPLNREMTHDISPSSFKRGYSRKQVLNHRYETNTDAVIENFPSGSIMSNTHKFLSTKNRNINFVLQSPEIIHTKFHNFPQVHTFPPVWPRSHYTVQSRFFDNSRLNTYPSIPKIPHSNQRHSQTPFALSTSLTPPSTINIPLYYSQNIQT